MSSWSSGSYAFSFPSSSYAFSAIQQWRHLVTLVPASAIMQQNVMICFQDAGPQQVTSDHGLHPTFCTHSCSLESQIGLVGEVPS